MNEWVEVLSDVNVDCVFNNAQKMKFSIVNIFRKCDQIRRKLTEEITEEFTEFTK